MAATDQALRLASMGGTIANLRKENARLQSIVDEFARVVYSADSSPTLYCGFYTAKEYKFTSDQIKRLKTMIAGEVG